MPEFAFNRSLGLAALGVVTVLATIATAALWPTEAARDFAAAVVDQSSGDPDGGRLLPRFVSLKNEQVNVRRGPSKDHPIAFQFQRAALPVEIIREFENWRLIRDSEGEEGWVFHSLLSGIRTAMVAPWDRDQTLRALRTEPKPDAEIKARIEPQVLVAITECGGTWCAVEADGHDGYLAQDQLWGVYPDERIE